MRQQDLRLRFFTPVHGLTHPVAARLSQLDDECELALLAEFDGIPIGVAHFFADPDGLRSRIRDRSPQRCDRAALCVMACCAFRRLEAHA